VCRGVEDVSDRSDKDETVRDRDRLRDAKAVGDEMQDETKMGSRSSLSSLTQTLCICTYMA